MNSHTGKRSALQMTQKCFKKLFFVYVAVSAVVFSPTFGSLSLSLSWFSNLTYGAVARALQKSEVYGLFSL